MDSPGKDSALKLYTTQEVSGHCDDLSCWIIISDFVYDVTNFLREHPGGEEIILEHAGADATMAYLDKGHSPDAEVLLKDYLVGQLVMEQRRPKVRQGGTS